MNVKNILLLVITTLVIILVLQNTQVVEVQFFFWKMSMSRALMLFGTFLIGLIAGWLLGTITTNK